MSVARDTDVNMTASTPGAPASMTSPKRLRHNIVRLGFSVAAAGLIAGLTGCSVSTAQLVTLPPSPSYSKIDQAKQARAVVSCLRNSGIEAIYHPSEQAFELTAPQTRSQVDVMHDLAVCKNAAGFADRGELTSTETQVLYFQDVRLYNCLTRAGLRIPPPPGFSRFRQLLATDPYIPYRYVTPADRAKLVLRCPQPEL